MPKLRTFIAVPIANSIKQELSKFQNQLKSLWGKEVKWVDIPMIHITLDFLGDVDDTLVDSIGQTMRQVLQNQKKFEISLENVATFPEPQRAKVIWAGIQDPQKRLSELNKIFEEAMLQFGIKPEEREFSPHITLGRIKEAPPKDIASVLEKYKNIQFGKMIVDNIILYKSTLRPQGSLYEPLVEIKLS